ncbi:MAG: 30S ribosomal protein S7 [Patescibacteria group bacterium]|nr:30S ribosomal protein S7 [Patescibacteria group bacterium]
MAKKRAKFVPEDSTELQEKFINYLMLDGKKSIARKIWRDTLRTIAEKGNKNPEDVFEKAIGNVKPTMEVRPKRIGGSVYQIPIEVKYGRQLMLSFRWILGAARDKKGSKMAQRLAQELLDAANEQGSAIKKKEDTHRMAAANKAFAHYAKF